MPLVGSHVPAPWHGSAAGHITGVPGTHVPFVVPNETAAEGFPGAVLVPLSSFDPAAIPDPAGKQVVFACRSGKRSVTASQAAQSAGLPYDAHLAGGILAWKAAGHPTET